MEKKILGVIYLDHDGLEDKEPFNNKDTHTAYSLFSTYAEKKGLRIILGKPEDYRDGGFVTAWDLLANKKVNDISIDACWDRCQILRSTDFRRIQTIREEIAKFMLISNHPKLARLSDDKYETFRMFPTLIPQTFLGSEFTKASAAFKGRVVIKARYGVHGHDIKIGDISEAANLDDDFIVQPFIDSTKGIPGIVEGPHDLRVTMLNNTIADTYIRKPKTGLISNVSLGGEMVILEKEKLPKSIVDIAMKIDENFSTYIPRLYSIDFMMEGERPWIVELNNAPGIWGHIARGISMEYYEKYCNDIIDAFVEAMTNPLNR
jgi:glutathione synthase/RimK-type ligase-like ATP-grasp enzyme